MFAQLKAYNVALYSGDVDENLITNAQCCEIYAEITGRQIKPSTWRSYVARKQAPQPVDHPGSTPLYDRAEVEAHVRGLPRIGVDRDAK